MFAITSDSLTKIYKSGIAQSKGITALRDISLHVERGQVFSLLGPNGAGKTTFIKILLSLTRPTSGEVSILDTRLPDTGIRKRVGYLPENHRYPGYLTAEQVLHLFGSLGGTKREALHSRIAPLLDLVGLSQWKKMKVRKYSKGMLQRLGLAQALVNDPEVLFLDEPTDGVDPMGRKEIRTILQDLRQKGKTIFLNSHLLSEVELVSDRVAILDKGHLLKVGTVEELTSTGQQYQIGIAGTVVESFTRDAAALVLKLSYAPGRIDAELGSTGELNKLIDLLRTHHIDIISIVKKRSSLEDSFLSLIKREAVS
jgi:ABC-2 type transport system ATP-binding protein